MDTRKNKGRRFSKKRTNNEESTFASGIPVLEDLHFDCGRHRSSTQFKESLFEISNHVVRNINYGGDKLAARIRNLQMVVIVVPDKVADNVAATTLVRHKTWLGDWTASSKKYHSLQQAIQKGYATVFKMFTPISVTKLEGENGYSQVCANQYVAGMILLICGIFCEYNIDCQDTYEMMQAKKRVTLLWKPKD